MDKKYSVVCLLLIGVILAAGCSGTVQQLQHRHVAAKDFIIAGSGQNLPITAKLVEYYNKKNKPGIKLPNSIGSTGAINAVKEGAIDLGLTARPLTDKEKNEGLREIPYARVGIIVGVNPKVPDTSITYQDLVDIFRGEKTVWQNGKPIIVLSRETGDSTNNVLVKKVPGFKEVLTDSLQKQRWLVYFSDAEEANAITATLFSLGFTDTGALAAQKLKIKPLRINGVEPSVENVQNGSYKLFNDLYFIYKEPVSLRAGKFLNFVFSETGVRIIQDNRGIPLRR